MSFAAQLKRVESYSSETRGAAKRMSDSSPLDTEVISQIAGLKLRARRVVEGLLAGAHRNPRGGASIEFAEHREYTPGDDLRYLDWKAYGRTDRLYLKQFEDETNFSAMFVVDTSGSLAYRGPTAPWPKWECAQVIAAALSWLIIQQGDAAGLALFADGIREWLAPATVPGQVPLLVDRLESSQPTGPTDWAATWHQVLERLAARTVVVVISDFLCPPDQTVQGLATLRHAGHDVVAFHVIDPAERVFPFRRLTRFCDLEGKRRVIAETRMIRARYRTEFAAYLKTLEYGCQNESVDYIRIETDQPLGSALANFLGHRAREAR